MKSMPVKATLFVFLLGLMLTVGIHGVGTSAEAKELTRFTSYEELKAFLGAKSQPYGYYQYDDSAPSRGSLMNAAEGGLGSSKGAQDYSTTNIQVEGVDEADIIKTDGEFIYTVCGTEVIIARAYPAGEAEIMAKIELNERADGIYVKDDRLVVMHQNWNDWVFRYEGNEKPDMLEPSEMPVPQTYIRVYDISDKANPVLSRNMSVDGNYFGSRMAGDYVYVIINASAYEQDGDVDLPVIHLGSTDVKIDATDIYYIDINDYYYNFTTVVAINIKEDNRQPKYETLLLGASSNLYVSMNNIYITSTVLSSISEKTAIHRIRTSGDNIAYEASGEVPGRLLNQFSMDENEGVFRLATTTGHIGRSFEDATSENHLYILDRGMNILGSVENLAPGEQIYSARFVGKRAYMVTFKKVDPLFVIDLTNPYHPKVLGELKITGYSDYLHPYDENHLLGIGKETIAADEGDFAWYQGVKISLFDVTDVANPMEISEYEIGDRGTDSPVLRDHKALLFDREKNLLVIPVWLAEIDEAEYPYGVISPYAYGETVWQGAYVFDVSIDGGIQVRGGITHHDSPSQVEDYYYGNDTVQRSLYIENVLYTVSEAKIKMNSLEDLSQINELLLS
ncbi:beta-propeller domain-containing protein [Chloroflexota bacterium]